MQAGRPYGDRLFYSGQLNRAIASGTALGAIAPLFSFPSTLQGARMVPLRVDDKRCDRLFYSVNSIMRSPVLFCQFNQDCLLRSRRL
jgi:hypothetical protein